MVPAIAAVIFAFGIAFLFVLDRQGKEQIATARPSKALWVPVIWLLIAGSRNVGEWLQMRGPADQSERYLDGNPIDRTLLATLIAIGLIVLFRRSRQVVALLRANAPILIFFLYCALSSLWSDYPGVAFKRWIRGFGDVVMVLVILTETDWVSSLKRVLTRVGFLLLPLSVLLIRFYPSLGRGYSISGDSFWTGVAEDKNGLGMICLIFGLGAVWRFIEAYRAPESKRRKRELLATGILVATTLYLLWASNSMTSISCFVLAGGLMAVTVRWSWARRPLIVTLFAVTAVGVSAFVLFGGASGALEFLGRNPTLTGRTEVWNVLLPFAQNSLVGSGYESFWLGSRLLRIGDLTANGINEAHNGYLEIYLNLGWVGITLLALVVITAFPKVVRGLREAHDGDAGKLMLAYFVLALIYNFTEAAFKMMNPVWVFFLLAVMTAPSYAAAQTAPSPVVAERSGFAEFKPQFKRRGSYS